jgi:DNA-directed RNA polymerase specialized sigma24 family protein
MSTDQVGVLTDASKRNLCARIRAGDSAAETVLIMQLQSGLRLLAYRASGSDFELARDVCQEALVMVLRRLRTTGLEDPAGLQAFATDMQALAAAPDPRRLLPEQLASGRLAVLVRQLVGELPHDRDRTILIRFYLSEDDKSEICRDLNLTELGFNQVVFRARTAYDNCCSRRESKNRTSRIWKVAYDAIRRSGAPR